MMRRARLLLELWLLLGSVLAFILASAALAQEEEAGAGTTAALGAAMFFAF